MKLSTLMLSAMVLAFHPVPSYAGGLVSIPKEVSAQMKKGKFLDQVWASPGFDSTKGIKVGRIKNVSEDAATEVVNYFPTALGRLNREGTPYHMEVSVTQVKLKTTNQFSSAKVEAEGWVVDQNGEIVAAFAGHATETIGGNQNENARIAVRSIVFALTKELFPTQITLPTKPSSTIVAAPKGSGVIMPGAGRTASSGRPGEVSVGSAQQVLGPLIPPDVEAKMKRGKALTKVWINPDYDRTRGFSIGEVLYQTDKRNDGIDQYLPDALRDIATKNAPCSLQLRIVGLEMRGRAAGGNSLAKLDVDGTLTAKDGTLLAAFKDHEDQHGTGDQVDDCRTNARKMIRAIVAEFK